MATEPGPKDQAAEPRTRPNRKVTFAMPYVRDSAIVGGKEISIETGKWAKLAGGAAVIRCGETIVLVTAAGSPGIRDLGFMPLTDCAPVVAASLLGFAEAEGLRIELTRETSWATLRDHIAVRER